MRPVVKGLAPNVYTKYGAARSDLIDRIGHYCNYCDMALYNQPQVEHVQPKSLVPDLELDWDNFLLACGYCNSTKSNKPVNLITDVFADTDNLLMAVKTDGVRLLVRDDVPQNLQALARSFLNLVGRDRDPYNPNNPDRWTARFITQKKINNAKMMLEQFPDNVPMRTAIIDMATGYGHFPMWFDAFEMDRDMRLRLIEAFPGTARDCFDADGLPINRPGGKM